MDSLEGWLLVLSLVYLERRLLVLEERNDASTGLGPIESLALPAILESRLEYS